MVNMVITKATKLIPSPAKLMIQIKMFMTSPPVEIKLPFVLLLGGEGALLAALSRNYLRLRRTRRFLVPFFFLAASFSIKLIMAVIKFEIAVASKTQ
jgi:hypothetical protein